MSRRCLKPSEIDKLRKKNHVTKCSIHYSISATVVCTNMHTLVKTVLGSKQCCTTCKSIGMHVRTVYLLNVYLYSWLKAAFPIAAKS